MSVLEGHVPYNIHFPADLEANCSSLCYLVAQTIQGSHDIRIVVGETSTHPFEVYASVTMYKCLRLIDVEGGSRLATCDRLLQAISLLDEWEDAWKLILTGMLADRKFFLRPLQNIELHVWNLRKQCDFNLAAIRQQSINAIWSNHADMESLLKTAPLKDLLEVQSFSSKFEEQARNALTESKKEKKTFHPNFVQWASCFMKVQSLSEEFKSIRSKSKSEKLDPFPVCPDMDQKAKMVFDNFTSMQVLLKRFSKQDDMSKVFEACYKKIDTSHVSPPILKKLEESISPASLRALKAVKAHQLEVSQ